MKHVYLFVVFVLFINLTNAQDEQLLGQWTMDSIWDFDILLENPANPITIEFNGETSSIIINSFCGQTYESFYTPATLENSFDITATSWNYMACSEDTQGFEGATNLLLDLDFNSTEPKTIDYTITSDGSTTMLVLTHNYIIDDTPTSTIGFFTKVSTQPNTAPIYGDWYLYSVNVDGTSTYNGVFDYYEHPILSLTNTVISDGYIFNGFVCNYQYGGYSIDETNNSITINSMNITLGDCDETNINNYNLEDLYFFDVFTNDDNSFAIFDYTISGPTNSEILTLTNTNNSNYAVYGKLPQSPDILGEWFLNYLVIDSNQINKPANTLPTVEFTTNPNTTGFYFGGIAACTGYSGDYHFNPQQTFSRDGGLNVTLGNPCDTNEENSFEGLYFYSVLDTDVINEFDYEITGTGDDATLVITNLSNGNKAFYGRQALSIDENIASSFKISLDKNPVNHTLSFSNAQDVLGLKYEIYTITGKRVLNGNLNRNTIDVKPLQSGLYILKVSNGSNRFETLKFIIN